MTLKLFGCSFTNWIYPTWADFVKLHYDTDVEIYGRPGPGNQGFKKLLMLYAVPGDHAIVMLSGNDRLDHGIDIQFVKSKLKYYFDDPQWANMFVNQDTMFVPINETSYDFTKHFSLFHALYTQAENIVDMQNYCCAHNVDYNFLSWQELFSDLSYRKQRAGLGKPVNLKKFLKNPIFNRVYNLIDVDSFLDDFSTGLLNFVHNDRRLFDYQPTWDFHPSCYANFQYFVKYIKPKLDTKYSCLDNLVDLESRAKETAIYYANTDCTDEPFCAPGGDNEFVKQKFYNMREYMIERFFNPHKQQLSNGYHYE